MKSLTTEQIYWLTLIGIAFSFSLLGWLLGYNSGFNHGYDDAIDEFADPEDADA